MAWQGVEGHDNIVGQFRRAAQRGRLSGSYLFIGPEGIGKRKFAVALAKALLCLNNPETDLNPCGQCASCREIDKNSHPDLEIVSKPADKSLIPLELIIGDVEHRNLTGICHFLSIKPQFAKRKIAILDDADFLNAEGANSMLKTLEEPPANALFILLGTSAAKQLPTIRSRCRIVRFNPLSTEIATQILQNTQHDNSNIPAEVLAAMGQGSIALAKQWIQPGFIEFRQNLLRKIGTIPFDALGFSQLIQNFAVADNRKDSAPQKRAVVQAALSVVMQFWGIAMQVLSGENIDNLNSLVNDPDMLNAVQSRLNRWNWDSETAAKAIEISIKIENQLQRNVHPMLLCDTWADKLANLFNTGDSN